MPSHKSVLQALLPQGALWQPAPGEGFDNFLDGRALNEGPIISFLKSLASIRDPYRTPLLEDLEKEYAIIPNEVLTDDTRRAELATKMYQRAAGGARDELQDKLHRAGFTNLFVYDNAPTVDPDPIVNGGWEMVCGEALSQCGEPAAQCGGAQGELVVNGDVFSFGIDYTMLCGEALAQCDEADAHAGAYAGVTRTKIPYEIPDGSDHIFRELFDSPARLDANGGVPSDGLTIRHASDFLKDGDSVRNIVDWPGVTDFSIVTELVMGNMLDGHLQTFASIGIAETLVDSYMEDAGVGAWTVSGSTVATKQTMNPKNGNQVLRVATGGASHYVYQIVTTIGAEYRATGWARSDSVEIPYIKDGGGTTLWSGTASTLWQYFDVTYVAATTSIWLGSVDTTGYVDFDSILVRRAQVLADADMETVGIAAWTAATSVITKQTSNPVSGLQLLRVAYNGVPGYWAYQTVVTIGVTYRFTGWMRSDGAATPRVIDGTGAPIFVGTTSANWQYFDVQYAPAAASVWFGSLDSSGYVEFDDLDVRAPEVQLEYGIGPVNASGVGKSPYFYTDIDGYTAIPATVFDSKEFVTCILTFDASGNVKFYVNGGQVGATQTGKTLGSTAGFITLGNSQRDSDFSDGRVFDVTVYDRILTDDEIDYYNRYTDRSLWSKFFYVGGEATRDPDTNEIFGIEYAQINTEDRGRLRRIILQHKPLHSWCGLCVNYV